MLGGSSWLPRIIARRLIFYHLFRSLSIFNLPERSDPTVQSGPTVRSDPTVECRDPYSSPLQGCGVNLDEVIAPFGL